jgi:hypothetical protein
VVAPARRRLAGTAGLQKQQRQPRGLALLLKIEVNAWR